MRKKSFHYLSVVVSAILLVAMVAAWAPAKKVSAASNYVDISGSYTASNGSIWIYERSEYTTKYTLNVHVTGIKASDTVYVHVHKYGQSYDKNKYLVSGTFYSNYVDLHATVNASGYACTSGFWQVDVEVRNNNKSYLLSPFYFYVIKSNAVNFMNTLLNYEHSLNFVLGAASLSQGGSACNVVRAYLPNFSNRSNREYVILLYQRVLGRYPGSAEVDWWVGQLNSGKKTRKQVLDDFVYSPEFKGRCGNMNLVW